ncbi:aspartate 1-decarboxylase [Oleidesulfovibrio sp.]|uniref:aspartate 1-decarboxylase n=1 Tax=Oleidesulfovibrio sp. TaxID=2909707 RepID=UPI003A87115B
MIKMIRAKLHGLKVTDSNLNYRGSITLDPLLCKQAGIYPLEYVYIWNKTNGERTSTYVIFGEPGSKCCVLNGASARRCQPGDEVIIGASEYVNSPEDICNVKPTVLLFDDQNNVAEVLKYDAYKDGNDDFQFQMVPAD